MELSKDQLSDIIYEWERKGFSHMTLVDMIMSAEDEAIRNATKNTDVQIGRPS